MNTTIPELVNIRKRIKYIRFQKGLTQDNMADILNISQNSYHKLENGHSKMCLGKFIQIAKILEVETSELINGPKHQFSLSEFFPNDSVA